MQNSFLQAHNLDGVFEIDDSSLPDGAVLLIDDMVDSRWTFTVIAALLKRVGCPAVVSHGFGRGEMEPQRHLDRLSQRCTVSFAEECSALKKDPVRFRRKQETP